MLSLKPEHLSPDFDHKAIVSQLSIKRLKTGNLWGFYRRELGVLRATRLIDNATEVGNRSSFFYEHHWTKKMFDLFIMWCHYFAKSFYWSHLFLSFLLHVLKNEGWTFHPQSQNFPSGDSANVWWDLSSWCLGIHKYQLASFKDPRDAFRKYSKMSIWPELFWPFLKQRATLAAFADFFRHPKFELHTSTLISFFLEHLCDETIFHLEAWSMVAAPMWSGWPLE